MKQERKLAKELLNAVWNDDVARAQELIEFGADPSWVFNGYPILHHAVYLRNKHMVRLLLANGAAQIDSALGFALDRGIGDMIGILAYQGAIPNEDKGDISFGFYPSRYAPLDYQQLHH